MDNQQIPSAQAVVNEVHEKQPPKNHRVFLYVLYAVAFLAVGITVYLLTQNAEPLVSESQKLLYPLFAGGLLGGMTVLWLYHQTTPSARLGGEVKAWFFPVLTGALSLFVAIIAYIFIGMWPVGEKSAMIVDMHHQYAPMLSQLREMLLGGGSVFYNMEIGSGTSFIPLFAYYLASPLNVLLILFPQAYLAEGILVVTLIKMALTGAFMALCVQYIFKRRNYASVAIGIMYAFSMYVLAYSWDIMWLDCVMFLPLVIMGFEHMMRTGKYLLYVLTLAYTLYANYYIGFMVCIFLVLYYAVFFFRAGRSLQKQAVGFARFAIGSLLGGGLAMFILLPSFLSLASTSAAGGSMPEFATNFNVFEIIGRGLYGVEPTIRSGNLPNLYCGVLAVLALPIFATMSSVPLRRRLAYMGLFAVMTCSLVINQIDLLWHGMHSPNDLPYRYSFLYSFAILLIAYEVLYRIKDVKPVQIFGSIFGIGVYLILEEQFGTEDYSYISLYVSFALIVVYGVIMLLVSQKKMATRAAYTLLAAIIVGEMMFNASSSFVQMNANEHYTAHASYLDNEKTQAVQATVDRMEELGDAAANGDFYRVEFLPRRTTTDTALFGYRGISVFASSGSYEMTRFMGSMGYNVNGVNSQMFESCVPTADSLMGLKYIALEQDIKNHPQLVQLEKVTVGETSYYIYENPYALSVGFMVDEAVKDWEYSYYDPMISQNTLFKYMTATTQDVMNCSQITTPNEELAYVSGKTAFGINAGSPSAIFKAVVEKEGRTFIHVDCRAAKSIHVSAGGNSWGVTTYQPYIIDAGSLPVGTEVTVTITTENGCGGNVFVATMDQEVFEQDMAILSQNELTVDSFSDSHLHGNIHVDKAGVMLTSITYDKGWTVKVDGRKVDTFAVGNALLGIDLEPGDHEIDISFIPSGFIPGAVISLLSVVALVLLLDYLKCRDTGKGMIFRKRAQKETAAEAVNQEIENKGADAP